MNVATQVAAFLAAALHVLIFGLESLWFMQPRVHRRFGAATPADAAAVRLFAFNQGFYNLFLALGVLAGLVLQRLGRHPIAAETLVLFGCACMLAAAAVLAASAGRRMWRAAALQGLFPLLAWAAWLAG